MPITAEQSILMKAAIISSGQNPSILSTSDTVKAFNLKNEKQREELKTSRVMLFEKIKQTVQLDDKTQSVVVEYDARVFKGDADINISLHEHNKADDGNIAQAWRAKSKHRTITSQVNCFGNGFGERYEKPYPLVVTTGCGPNLMGTSVADKADFTCGQRIFNAPYYFSTLKLLFRRWLHSQDAKGTQVVVFPLVGGGVYINQLNLQGKIEAKSYIHRALKEALEEEIFNHIKEVIYALPDIYSAKQRPQRSADYQQAIAIHNDYQGKTTFTIANVDVFQAAYVVHQAGKLPGLINPGSDRTIGGYYFNFTTNGIHLHDFNDTVTLEELICNITDLIFRHCLDKNTNGFIYKPYSKDLQRHMTFSQAVVPIEKSGIRYKIGTVISRLLREHKDAISIEDAKKGINLMFIELSSSEGLTLYFPFEDYAHDFYQALLQWFGKRISLKKSSFSKEVGNNKLEYKATINISDHKDIICFINYICYANAENLYKKANWLGDEKKYLADIYRKLNKPMAESIRIKVIKRVHKIRLSPDDIICINAFLLNIHKLRSMETSHLIQTASHGSPDTNQPNVSNSIVSNPNTNQPSTSNNTASTGTQTNNKPTTQTITPGCSVVAGDYITCAIKQKLQHGGKKVAILNMANADTPGGAVIRAKGSAEEQMCRVSDLYLQLLVNNTPNYTTHPLFLFLNKCPLQISAQTQKSYVDIAVEHEEAAHSENNKYQLANSQTHYTNDTRFLIDPLKEYTPDNTVLLDVISSAAIDLRKFSVGTNRYKFGIFSPQKNALFIAETKTRIRNIFDDAMKNKVDILVLSGYGCGAFENPPAIIAVCFREVMAQAKYTEYLKQTRVIFSILPGDNNYDAFVKEFEVNARPAHILN